MSTNGSVNQGPPFAVFGTAFNIVPRAAVIEMLESNAQAQAKGNLALGPLFRKVADDFRAWSKDSEPGWVFRAPEVNLHIVRLATFAPLCTSLSEAARKKAEAEAAAPAEPDPNDRPLILHP